MKKLNAKKNTNKPEIPGKVKKGYRIYVMAVLALTLTMSMGMTAFAAGDPITVVNNLSDFIFGLIRAVGLILLGWGIVQVGVNMMIAPAVAVLSDRIPENVRGTFSAFYGGAQIVGSSAGTFLGSKFIENMGTGFAIGAALFAVTGIVTVLIWPRERSSAASVASVESSDATAKLDVKQLLRSFIPPTKNCRDFYLALMGRLLLILGWNMISGYQLYILQKYCGLSVKDSAATISTMSVISMVVLIVTSMVSGPLSDRLQRRKVIVAIGSVIIAIGVAIPCFMPNALGMMLFAGIGGAGYGIYIAVDQALNVDVLPSQEEAGKDLGILNLANTVGQVLAPEVVGAIVLATGSYAALFPIAVVAVLLGAVFIMLIRRVK